MGNAGAGGGGKKAKVMNINGELFKLNTPAKAQDIIKDYPGHVLIDSDDFLRFNLRAQPLDPQSDLRSKKIYLLVQLPRFPAPEQPPELVLRRTSSGGILSPRTPRLENFRRRSNSDSPIFTGEIEACRDSPSPRNRSVKVLVPKAEVERIVEQSMDEVEAAEKIIDLCMETETVEEGDGVAGERQREDGRTADETTEAASFSKYCINFYSLCSPYITHHRSKYKKLTKD